jgi:hypothetical protein
VHPFWSSHEEKRACVSLSMGGQPWPELELHGPAMGSLQERGGEGGEGGAAGRRHGELLGRWGLDVGLPLLACVLSAVSGLC